MYKAISPGNIGHGLSFKSAAEVSARHGFTGFSFDIAGDSVLPAEETKELLKKTGMRAAGFGLPVDFRGDRAVFESGLAELKNYARYAAEIGANRCVTWIMPSSDTVPYEENFIFHRDRLKKCCEILREYGVVFGMEFVGTPSARRNAKYDFIYNLDQMLDLCGAIGTGNAGLLLDVWHWDLAGQTKNDFKKLTNELVAYVHINDAPAGVPAEDQVDSVRGLPGETGVLKIADFFEGLLSIGYDGPVVAEPFEPKLAKMPYEEALSVVMDSINRVWPK